MEICLCCNFYFFFSIIKKNPCKLLSVSSTWKFLVSVCLHELIPNYKDLFYVPLTRFWANSEIFQILRFFCFLFIFLGPDNVTCGPSVFFLCHLLTALTAALFHSSMSSAAPSLLWVFLPPCCLSFSAPSASGSLWSVRGSLLHSLSLHSPRWPFLLLLGFNRT